jgi:hypothetical protein
MVSHGSRFTSVLLLLLATPALFAQKAGRVESVPGSVVGSVTCADTNAPARFAVVTLQGVPMAPGKGKASFVAGGSASGESITTTTDIEGRFLLDKVRPGRYFVLSGMVGYLNPLARFENEQLRQMSEETTKQLAQTVPVVSVEPGQSATVTLRLERAAELSGTVLYDDGSPAVEVQVELLRKDKQGRLADAEVGLIQGLSSFSSQVFTDDHGRYRIIGLSPGSYAVRATLPALKITVSGVFGGSGQSSSVSRNSSGLLQVYSGNKFRGEEAALVDVGSGEQVGGVDITIPVDGLHTVQGSLTAKRDGHGIEGSPLELLFADDRETARSVETDDNGDFQIPYVPTGSYILRASGPQDVERNEDPTSQGRARFSFRTIQSYKEAELPLLVQGDVTGANLVVVDAQTAKSPARP